MAINIANLSKVNSTFFIEALHRYKALINEYNPNKTLSCILSYAWGIEEHEKFVEQFALEFEQAGFQVYLDIWFDRVGKDLNSFINFFDLNKVDYILPVATVLKFSSRWAARADYA